MAYQSLKTVNPMPGGDAAIPTTKLAFNPGTGKHGKQAKADRFIRGPIPFDWVQKANALPGKAGAVGFALWFIKGVKRSSTFAVTAEAETLAGCSRQAFARGLDALASINLISIVRCAGARPRVTICV